MINSAALHFEKKPWFTIKQLPKDIIQNLKKERQNTMDSRKAFLKLIHDEKFMNLPAFVNRVKREKGRATKMRKRLIAE